MSNTYFEPKYLILANLFLGVTCILSFCSFFFRAIPNYWYANILSLLNLLCGLIGIVLVIYGGEDYLKYAFGLVFLGQFLDLFDGRAAERWGSPPSGELFDDLADGTNFGGTIAIIVLYSFESFMLGLVLAVMHLVATVYRLIRFLADKKEAGVSGGVMAFKGLPSPGGALFTGSAMVFLNDLSIHLPIDSLYVKIAIVIIGSALMISHVPYVHFGRAWLPKVPKFFRVFAYSLILMLILIAYRTQSDTYLFISIFVVSLMYLFFGIEYKNLFKRKA